MTSQEDSLDLLHEVYKNDPILFNSYVGKEVKITTKDEDIIGIIYTVDPVSKRLGKYLLNIKYHNSMINYD